MAQLAQEPLSIPKTKYIKTTNKVKFAPVRWNLGDRLTVFGMGSLVVLVAMLIVYTKTIQDRVIVQNNQTQTKITDTMNDSQDYQNTIQKQTDTNNLAKVAKENGMTQNLKNIKNVNQKN